MPYIIQIFGYNIILNFKKFLFFIEFKIKIIKLNIINTYLKF